MPAQLKPSGAVTYIPQEHTYCGLCRASFMFCGCTGMPHACNYILMDLPPPAPASTPAQLIQRWCSLISMSMSMAIFNAEQWYQDQGPTLLRSFQTPKLQLLDSLVEDYITGFSTDPTLPVLVDVVGGSALSKKSKAAQMQAVSAEARAALKIFQSGDWSCLTFIGSMLLQNAFQLSDPQKYRTDDPDLAVLFEFGIGLLSHILGKGFSKHGYRLAMEPDRRPCIGTSLPLASATERLSS